MLKTKALTNSDTIGTLFLSCSKGKEGAILSFEFTKQ